MTTWIKKNNKWQLSNNNVKYTDFVNNLKKLDIEKSDGKNVVYIPTHNINDVYEWFRIFKDAYAYTDNKDPYGIAIHGYFNADRGQSIKGWFKNMVEVKATSSNILKYYNDNTNYYRSSIDFIQNFNITNLLIDNTKIYENEKVLLKNQSYETLTLFNVDALSNKKSYYLLLSPGEEKYFSVDSTLIIKNGNEFVSDIIKNINTVTIGLNKYTVLTTENDIISNSVTVGDLNSGLWTFNSLETQNGVYEYLNDQLTLIPDMFDKFKLYNQIIFTYQGETNINKQFYLRRTEDVNSANYSLFPVSGGTDPMKYSLGDAHLLKVEFDYSLNSDQTTTTINDLISCCNCTISSGVANVITHPITTPPFNETDDIFRLLYLDLDIARKVMSTDDFGIGTYKVDDPISFNYAQDVLFLDTDKDGLDNILKSYLNDIFYNYPTIPVVKSFQFIYNALTAGQSYSIQFDDDINFISYTQNSDNTEISLEYTGDVFPPTVTFESGTSINLKYVRNDITLLDQNFLVKSNSVNNGTNLVFEVFPKFDTNFLNELLSDDYQVTIDIINVYGELPGNSQKDAFIDAYKKSFVSHIYDFKFNDSDLTFLNIKQNNKYKWTNYGAIITINTIDYYIEHTINPVYRKYFYDYNINNYMTNYLGITANKLKMNDIAIIVNIDKNDPLYFNVLKNNKYDLPLQGNIIEFGVGHKDLILSNILPDTQIDINYTNIPGVIDEGAQIDDPWIANAIWDYTEQNGLLDFLDILANINITANSGDIWVSKVIWDDEIQIGRIITLNNFIIPNDSDTIIINNLDSIGLISNKLLSIFDKSVNPSIGYETNPAYKVDTASYAYTMLNYALNGAVKDDSILTNTSAIIYKEYNEPRISFLKRDKFFPFNNDDLEIIDLISTANHTLINPGMIDGTVLNNDDIVILKYQTTISENGIYKYNSSSNTLIPYNDIYKLYKYYKATSGIINTDKTVQLKPINNSVYIEFVYKSHTVKYDKRMTLKPIEICRLGVDNERQNWKKINYKYDVYEKEEYLLGVSIGANRVESSIRFIDGLSEDKIINNIDGQGQYSWILNENTSVTNAVVGCTQINGPGTGDLIWYTGTWNYGTWCNGIWIQGKWKNGTWVNGIHKANPIIDNVSTVTIIDAPNDILSTWDNGTWINGTWEKGKAYNITWIDGIFNNGLILSGIWYDGKMYNGKISNIIWETGTLYGGDFENGLWKTGTLDQLTPTIPARFGTKATGTMGSGLYLDRAIWLSGSFTGGQFHSGDNTEHFYSVWYDGNFVSGDWYGGSFIMGTFGNGTWYDGVWFGGYKATITNIGLPTETSKLVTVDPTTYDEVLGLTTTTGYITHTKHNFISGASEFYLIATPTNSTTFGDESFINIREQITTLPYVVKPYTSVGNNTITLTMSALDATTPTYTTGNPGTETIDTNPVICAVFSGLWKNGLFLNGLFLNGSWERGLFVNGYFANGTFGL